MGPATTQQGQAGPIPDLVNRDFTADAPGRKMVGDITYIPTWEGWVYLATVIDCATRKIAGWAMDDNYRTPLITSAIEMAARNLGLPADAVFHSDRGSNYTSAEFAAALGRLGIRQSVGRTGICYDNALAESFNAALKVERVHRAAYPARKKAKEDIARYIELRYNRMRLHYARDRAATRGPYTQDAPGGDGDPPGDDARTSPVIAGAAGPGPEPTFLASRPGNRVSNRGDAGAESPGIGPCLPGPGALGGPIHGISRH